MDELVAVVSKKTGLSTEQAKSVVGIVLDFLKKKLPAPIAGEVDAILSGKGPDLGEAANMLGSLFGGKK
jgi:hypothetical protein